MKLIRCSGASPLPLCVALLFCLSVVPAMAASISWDPVDSETTIADVIGGPVLPFEAVLFTPNNTPSTRTFLTKTSEPNEPGGKTTGNADFDVVYNTHGWTSTGAGSFTLEGLTDGSGYVVQVLSAGDTRGCCGGLESTVDDGMGNSSGTLVRSGPSSVVGSFTADATTQVINVVPVDPATGIGVSGYILTDAAGSLIRAVNYGGVDITVRIPEPATIALIGLAANGLLLVRRR